MRSAVSLGDRVEIAFNKATPQEIAARPGVYQTEADVGEVVSAPYLDKYGIMSVEVSVNGRRRKVATEKLTVVDTSRMDDYQRSKEASRREAAAAFIAENFPEATLRFNEDSPAS